MDDKEYYQKRLQEEQERLKHLQAQVTDSENLIATLKRLIKGERINE